MCQKPPKLAQLGNEESDLSNSIWEWKMNASKLGQDQSNRNFDSAFGSISDDLEQATF
jgi:hypothetical protein